MPSSYALATDVITKAAVELGLVPSLADPATSTDPSILQLYAQLEALCDDLVRDFDWSQMRQAQTFTTEPDLDFYTLPSGYLHLIDRTLWNDTRNQRLIGPLSAEEWQQLQVNDTSPSTEFRFRIVRGQIHLSPTPDDGWVIAYEYMSRYWGAPSYITNQYPIDNLLTGYIYFDKRLLITGLKYYFLRQKGFDVTAAKDAYERALARALSLDTQSPVLDVGGKTMLSTRPLDMNNLPDTGFGE